MLTTPALDFIMLLLVGVLYETFPEESVVRGLDDQLLSSKGSLWIIATSNRPVSRMF